MAKLPDQFVRKEPRKLKDLQVGEKCFGSVSCMLIDRSHTCWLIPDSEITTEKQRSITCLQIFRQEDGYHVTIIAPHQWTCNPVVDMLMATSSNHQWVPVLSITEDLEVGDPS